MLLYTCGAGTKGAGAGHPCGRAAKALDEAGIEYEIKVVQGYAMLPGSRGGGRRDELVQLTGKKDAPVLVTEDGEVVAGSRNIIRWARSQG